MRVLRPAFWATAIVVTFTALLTRVLRRPVAVWLDTPIEQGGWALLVASAAVAIAALGGASLWHAFVLTRLVRVRRIDLLIAALGVGMLALALAIVAAATIDPVVARAMLLLALPLWAAGIASACLAMAIFIHLRRGWTPSAFGAVLILGAGLRGRDVGPLLRRRVERGAEVWRRSLVRRPDARIVVSGGQGPDEVRTEASAMAEHLIRHLGVPATAIDLEEASTTTRENLELSRVFVAGPGRAPLAVVTSEYHAFRTAGLLAKVGFDGVVIGAWTRRSYLPGAVVREALALAAEYRWSTAGLAAALWTAAAWLLLQQP